MSFFCFFVSVSMLIGTELMIIALQLGSDLRQAVMHALGKQALYNLTYTLSRAFLKKSIKEAKTIQHCANGMIV